MSEKHGYQHSGSDVDKAMGAKYDVDVTPAGDKTVHDAVFGDLEEGGPDYRGVSLGERRQFVRGKRWKKNATKVVHWAPSLALSG